MAGSYNHVVANDGNLGSNEFIVDMLENGGDVFEAVEEMYGMIWFLAAGQVEIAAQNLPADAPQAKESAMKLLVEIARQHYKEGLEISRDVHNLFPDALRDDV